MKKDDQPGRLVKDFDLYRAKQTRIQANQLISDPLNIWSITFDYNNVNELDLASELRKRKEVITLQKNYIGKLREMPNDPLFDMQWPFIDADHTYNVYTDIQDAWEITTGGITSEGDSIVICVIDDGIDIFHEDLENNLWKNKGEIPDNDQDDDDNGYIDDVYGWDSHEDDGNVSRNGSHGTFVSGIVGAQGNNQLGVAGVNWNIKVMAITGGFSVANGIKAYAYAYQMRKKYNETHGKEGAFIVAVNSSWGFENIFEYQAPLFCEFYDMMGNVGIVNCAATSNSNYDVDREGDLPSNCSSPYLIVTTNLTEEGNKKSGAAFGNESVDLSAPGDQIFGARLNNRYGFDSGTSFASPLVAGTIGLVYATDCPYLCNLAEDQPSTAALLAKSLTIGGVEHNKLMADLTLTEGNLNIGNSVKMAQQLCDECVFPIDVTWDINNNQIIGAWKNLNSNQIVNLQYRKVGMEEWIEWSNIEKSITLQNLENCTSYEIRLIGECNTDRAIGPSYFITSGNCCEPPKNVFSDIREDDLVINWEDVNASSSYTIEYQENSSDEWIQKELENNEFTIHGITSCTGFKFRIKTNCENEFSEFTPSINTAINCDVCQALSYCEANYLDTEFEWIEEVIIGDVVFASGKNESGYGNYIGKPLQIFVPGTTIPCAIIPGFGAGAMDEYGKIFIDWNQNGEFGEEELVLSPESSSDTLWGDIEVPIDAVPGITRMRVVLSFNSFDNPCDYGELEYGEIEDYCVSIQSIGSCLDEILIDDFITTFTSIQIFWTMVSDAMGYQIEYRKLGDEIFEILESSHTDIIMNDLKDCTTYEIRIKSICDNQSSDYSRLYRIKTKCERSTLDSTNQIIDIYPNPFSQTLFFQFHEDYENEKVEFMFLNSSGKVVAYKDYQIQDGQLLINNLRDISAGLVILRVDINGKVFYKKLIKI